MEPRTYDKAGDSRLVLPLTHLGREELSTLCSKQGARNRTVKRGPGVLGGSKLPWEAQRRRVKALTLSFCATKNSSGGTKKDATQIC